MREGGPGRGHEVARKSVPRCPDRAACGRRTFFRGIGRGTVLGTMGLFAFLLYGRQRRDPEVCINRSVCGTCGVFAECQLPAARSAKEEAEAPASTREDHHA